MQLVVHYVELCAALAPKREPDREEIPVTVERIARVWYCSSRNVKLILRKMAELGWIEWRPGRGRGNHSVIRLIASAAELLLKEAKGNVELGNFKAALALLQLPGVDSAVKEQFMGWLGESFGYQEKGSVDAPIDTLRLPMRASVLTFDPADLFFARDLHFAKQVFDTLLRFDPEAGTVVPHLAHHWQSNTDGTEWTFYLRKGVRFHHGREMTSADVAFSLLRLKQRDVETSTNGWLAEQIGSVRTPSRWVIEIGLNAPNFMFPQFVSSSATSIVPEEIYQGSGYDAARLPVGTGPFRVTRHDDEILTLEAFEGYFRERAYLDRIEMLYLPKDVADQGKGWLYNIGKAYHFSTPAPASWKAANIMPLGSSMLAFNLRKPGPQQDARFREAVHRVLDRRRMIDELGMEGALPAEGFLPLGSTPKVWREPEPDEIRRLLNESGYKGEPLLLSSLEGHWNQSEWIRERCEAYGIRFDIHELSYADSAVPERILQADCKVGGVVADDDIARCLLEMYKMGNLMIRTYAPESFRHTLDARIAEVVAVSDDALRMEHIRQLEKLLTEDHRVLFLAHTTHRILFSPDLKGVSLNSLGWFEFRNIWFKRRRS